LLRRERALGLIQYKITLPLDFFMELTAQLLPERARHLLLDFGIENQLFGSDGPLRSFQMKPAVDAFEDVMVQS
jgi:hypothetical protein